jgi:hypothetical protein
MRKKKQIFLSRNVYFQSVKNTINFKTLDLNQITPPTSNDDEYQKSLYMQKGQSDEPNNLDTRQRNKREFMMFFLRKKTNPSSVLGSEKSHELLSNITNDIFCFDGPRCWIQFRLNRSEIFRCLHE